LFAIEKIIAADALKVTPANLRKGNELKSNRN